jgi:hypothetical protein
MGPKAPGGGNPVPPPPQMGPEPALDLAIRPAAPRSVRWRGAIRRRAGGAGIVPLACARMGLRAEGVYLRVRACLRVFGDVYSVDIPYSRVVRNKHALQLIDLVGVPKGIRTPVTAVKGGYLADL